MYIIRMYINIKNERKYIFKDPVIIRVTKVCCEYLFVLKSEYLMKSTNSLQDTIYPKSYKKWTICIKLTLYLPEKPNQ